ncbi:MAG: CoA-binding protein [Helicobacteraceae bacterium]|nr:CoA-binding protein [Helicobacteraceae bacterium]
MDDQQKANYKRVLSEAKHIAIAGLSPDETKPSYRVARYLQAVGYKIYPIYPKEIVVLGEKSYNSLAEIVDPVDAVVMFRKGEFAAELIADVEKKGGVKLFWLQEGIVNDAAIAKAKELGIESAQNICIMKTREFLFR